MELVSAKKVELMQSIQEMTLDHTHRIENIDSELVLVRLNKKEEL